MTKAAMKCIGYDSRNLAITGYDLMNHITGNMLGYGVDLAINDGFEVEQLLSPDRHVISDIEILMGVKTPALQIVAPCILEMQHITRSVLLLNAFKKKESIQLLNDNNGDYIAEQQIAGDGGIVQNMIRFLKKQHIKLYAIAMELISLDPMEHQLSKRNPNGIIDYKGVKQPDLNMLLIAAFANVVYHAINELNTLTGSSTGDLHGNLKNAYSARAI
jgi:hypothetical protein